MLLIRTEIPNFKSQTNIKCERVDIDYYSLKEQLILPGIIKKLNPDLVHFPHFNLPILTQFPFVVTIHDFIKHHFQGRETTTRQTLIYWFKYWGYKQVFSQAVTKAKKIRINHSILKMNIHLEDSIFN